MYTHTTAHVDIKVVFLRQFCFLAELFLFSLHIDLILFYTPLYLYCIHTPLYLYCIYTPLHLYYIYTLLYLHIRRIHYGIQTRIYRITRSASLDSR